MRFAPLVADDAVRMYYRWTFMPSSKDRRRPLALLASRGLLDCRALDIYHFGVYAPAPARVAFQASPTKPCQSSLANQALPTKFSLPSLPTETSLLTNH